MKPYNETDEQKNVRLARSAWPYLNFLSTLPIISRGDLRGGIIGLAEGITVVPVQLCGGGYVCVVVASERDAYKRGDSAILTRDELERGERFRAPLAMKLSERWKQYINAGREQTA